MLTWRRVNPIVLILTLNLVPVFSAAQVFQPNEPGRSTYQPAEPGMTTVQPAEPSPPDYQPAERGVGGEFTLDNTWDFYFKYLYMSSHDLTYNGPQGDVKLSVDFTNLYGLGLAYHFPFGLEPRFEVLWGNTNVHGESGPVQGLTHAMQVNTGTLNADWNILQTPFTPFIGGGIGWQYIQITNTNAPPVPVTTNYWDPWYGFVPVVGYTYPTFYQTEFMWNVDAGLRYNPIQNLFIKLYAEVSWVYYQNASDSPVAIPKYGGAIGATF